MSEYPPEHLDTDPGEQPRDPALWGTDAFDSVPPYDDLDLDLDLVFLLDALDPLADPRPRHPEGHTITHESEDDGVDLMALLPDAFAAFWHTHQTPLTCYALRHLDSISAAEAAVGGVMVDVHARWDALASGAETPARAAFRLLSERLDDHEARIARARHAIAPHLPASRRPGLRTAASAWAHTFTEFAHEVRPALTRLARRRLGDLHAEADEVVVEVMLVLARRWDLFEVHPDRRVALLKILDTKVDERCARGTGPRPGPAADHTAGPAAPACPGSSDDVVADTIALMPPRRGACAWLHLVMDLPMSDVAEYLGVTVLTVRAHVRRARRDLTAALHACARADGPAGPHPEQGTS